MKTTCCILPVDTLSTFGQYRGFRASAETQELQIYIGKALSRGPGRLKDDPSPFCKRLRVQRRLRSGSRVYKRRDCEGDSAFGVVALFAVMLRLRRPLRLSANHG